MSADRGDGVDYSYDLAVGRQIRAAREANGLTQEQLAAQLQTYGCDITRSALAKMEVGQRHIYAVELRALRQILDVSYEMLLP